MFHYSWIKHHHCITHTNKHIYIISYTIDFLVAQNVCNFQDLEANIIIVLWYICMWRQSVRMPSKRWGKNSSNKRDKCFALSSGQLLCSAKLHGSPAQRSVDQWKNLFGYDWYVVMVWMGMNTPATWIYLNVQWLKDIQGKFAWRSSFNVGSHTKWIKMVSHQSFTPSRIAWLKISSPGWSINS